jgi:phosphoribosylamine--glycine ligase
MLYCGLMWTASGPKVLEFNVRFGDPETQVLMPRVRGDLAKLLQSAASGALDHAAANFNGDPCVGIVLATREYPLVSTPVQNLSGDVTLPAAGIAFWGNSTLRDGAVDAAGGRVLTVAATGASLSDARKKAYEAVGTLGERMGKAMLTYRSDIALHLV